MLQDIVSKCYADAGFAPGSTVAVAFSGGADSVALLAATVEAGYRAVALHCNFHLRGDESDRDEKFAREFAAKLGVEINVAHFDVTARRGATRESVETACRELRYEWFLNQFEASSPRWKCVAIAHHANDNVETFFLNLLRGSGLRGLTAIPPNRGIFLRPLLDVSREDITRWLAERQLNYIVDSTNLLTDCRRNMLRNSTLPAFSADFPRLYEAVTSTVDNLRRDNSLLDYFIECESDRLTLADGSIDLQTLSQMPQAPTLLYHILNRKFGPGFSHATACSIIRNLDHTGAAFHSSDRTVTVAIHRRTLCQITHQTAGETELPVVTLIARGEVETPFGKLQCRVIPRSEFAPARDPFSIWIDSEQLPSDAVLTLRPRRYGDRIKPFGMRGSRLVSDIVSDAKLPADKKGRVPVMLCGEDIIWVPGLRASRLYTVQQATKRIIELHLSCNTQPQC